MVYMAIGKRDEYTRRVLMSVPLPEVLAADDLLKSGLMDTANLSTNLRHGGVS